MAGPGTNKSLIKALRLLACFGEEHPEWSVSELARHLNMPKSTVSGILASFREEDILRQSPSTGRYRLGLRCLELGYYASSQLLIRDVSFPYLQGLLEETQQIIYLGLPYQQEILYVEALYPLHRRVNYSSLGRRAPMHCTAIGKAMLAFMPNAEIERFLQTMVLKRFTPNTITDPNALRGELEATRERGYAIDAQEREIGIRCVGSPLNGHDGEVLGAISISGPESEITLDRTPEYGERVKTVAQELSRKLKASGF